MSAPRVKSAYRVSVDDLVGMVRDRATQLGRLPSQNQIQTEFRVGIDKARAVRAALLDSGFDPTTPGTDTNTGSPDSTGSGAGVESSPAPRRLHPVPDTSDSTSDSTTDSTAAAGGGGAARADTPAADGAAEHGASGGTGTASAATRPLLPAPASGAALGVSPGTADGHTAELYEQATTLTEPVPDTSADMVAETAADTTADTAADTAESAAPAAEPVSAEPVPAAGSADVVVSRPWWQVVALLLLSLPAFVAIWGGWVGLGRMTGFGDVVLLPGIADDWTIDSAITLPIGVETYAALALGVWLSHSPVPAAARRFAKWSALGALLLGMAGQVAYHLMSAARIEVAPWLITTAVSCLPVVVLGFGAALAHLLLHTTRRDPA